jgi:hypothetical protein
MEHFARMLLAATIVSLLLEYGRADRAAVCGKSGGSCSGISGPPEPLSVDTRETRSPALEDMRAIGAQISGGGANRMLRGELSVIAQHADGEVFAERRAPDRHQTAPAALHVAGATVELRPGSVPFFDAFSDDGAISRRSYAARSDQQAVNGVLAVRFEA